MDFPEKIHVELIPSVELEKIRTDISSNLATMEARYQSCLRLFYEALEKIAELKEEINQLKEMR